MGSFIKAIFGGKDSSAQKAQIDANAADRALFQKNTDTGIRKTEALMNAGDENRNMSFQQALSLLGGSLPAQLDVQQQGNVGAQQQLIQGLPMIQAALMGNPVNLASLQPTRITPDMSWNNTKLPDFKSSKTVLAESEAAEKAKKPDWSSIWQQDGWNF